MIERLGLPMPASKILPTLMASEKLGWEAKWGDIGKQREPADIRARWLIADELCEVLPQDITVGMDPYIRLRAHNLWAERGVLDYVSAARLEYVIDLGLRWGWSSTRTAATVVHLMIADDAAVLLIKELLDGILGPLTDTEFIAAAKQYHNINMIKVTRSWGSDRLDNRTLSQVIYLQSLAGRGHWPPKTTIQEQVDLRRTSAKPMKT
eukprot:2724842-Amphidinium_carterae.1